MRTVDLITRKRDGEELSAEELAYLVEGYTRGEIPDYQMSAFLMATFYSGMTEKEVGVMTELGTGVFEITLGHTLDPQQRAEHNAALRDLAVESGRPLTFILANAPIMATQRSAPKRVG